MSEAEGLTSRDRLFSAVRDELFERGKEEFLGTDFDQDMLEKMADLEEMSSEDKEGIQREFEAREKDKKEVGAREILQARLFVRGKDTTLQRLESEIVRGEYGGVVDVIEGIKALGKGVQEIDIEDLAVVIREGLEELVKTSQESTAAGISSQASFAEDLVRSITSEMFTSQQDGVLFGSPKYIERQVKRIISEFNEMKDEFFDNEVFGEIGLIPAEDLDLPDIDFENLTTEQQERYGKLIKKLKVWRYLVDVQTLVGPYKQMAGLINFAAESMGLDYPTYLGKLGDSLRTVEAFSEALKKTTERSTGQLEGVSPTAEDMSSILMMFRMPLTLRVEKEGGGFERVSVEISAAKYLDMLIGNVGEQKRDDRGRPVYINPNFNNGEAFVLDDLSDADQVRWINNSLTKVVFESGDDPARVGRKALGQLQYTRPLTDQTERGGGMLSSMMFEEIKAKGVDLEKVIGVETDHSDGDALTLLHPSVLEEFDAYKHKGFLEARREAVEYMLREAMIVRHGRIIGAARNLAETLQLTPTWDPALLFDHLPELWIKSFAMTQYAEKYGLDPDTMRSFIRNYLKPLIAWKMKDVDPVVIAMEGNENGVSAHWRYPLDVTKADEEAPKANQILPLGQYEDGRWKALEDEQKKIIEAVLYQRSDWMAKMSTRKTQANVIREISGRIVEADNEKKVKEISKELGDYSRKISDDYFTYYNKASPQMFPSSRQAAFSKLNGMSSRHREAIANIEFKEFLERAWGYSEEELGILGEGGTKGWAGLVRLVEGRSSGRLLIGQTQKVFKYETKYTEMGAAANVGLRELIVVMNNAIDPFVEKLAGGKQAQLGALKPDDALEALLVGAYDLFTFGMRSSEEAIKYIDEIAGVMREKIAPSIGFIGPKDARGVMEELVRWTHTYTQNRVETIAYQRKEGGGAAGTHRDRLEVNMLPSSEDPKVIDKWALQTREMYRAYTEAGFEVVFPEGADMSDVVRRGKSDTRFDQRLLEPTEGENELQRLERWGKLRLEAKNLGYNLRNPYIVFANDPIYKHDVEMTSDGWRPKTETGRGLALYGHRGGEKMMAAILIRRLMDANIITHDDAVAVIRGIKGSSWVDKILRSAESVREKLTIQVRDWRKKELRESDEDLDQMGTYHG